MASSYQSEAIFRLSVKVIFQDISNEAIFRKRLSVARP